MIVISYDMLVIFNVADYIVADYHEKAYGANRRSGERSDRGGRIKPH